MNLGISHIEFAKKKRTQSQNPYPRHRKRRSWNTSTNFLQLLSAFHFLYCVSCYKVVDTLLSSCKVAVDATA